MSHSRSALPLFAWVAAFLVHRAILAACGFDGLFFWEESYRLLVGEALRSGWNFPLFDLQADPYSGGSLVFAAMAALASFVVPSSLLLLKAVAVAWSAVGFWLWLLIADRVGGRLAAHCLGLVWLAAPPVFLVFNTVALGSHSDTITPVGLQLLLMLAYLGDSRRSPLRLAAWAAAAGFGVWFSYAAAPAAAVAALYVAACGAFPPRRWPVAAAAFLVGFSPWIVHAAVAGGSLDVVARSFSGSGGAARGYLPNLFDLLVHGVPVALYFRDVGIPGDVKMARDVVAYPYLFLYAAAWTGAMVRGFGLALASIREGGGSASPPRLEQFSAAMRAWRELPFLLLFPVFLAVVAASNQEFNDYGVVRFITFRILVPALPSLLFALALGASRAGPVARSLLLGFVAASGLLGSGQLLFDGSSTRASREEEARELGAEALGHLIVFKHGTVAGIARDRIDAVPPELRARAWRGVGFSDVYLYGTSLAEEPLSRLAETFRELALDGSNREAWLEGGRLAIGAGLAQVAPVAATRRTEEISALLDRLQASSPAS